MSQLTPGVPFTNRNAELLNPNVSTLSPSLYTAAINSPTLNAAQANQINQIAGTVNLNKELLSMNGNAAAKRWKTLDPHIQEQVKALYGDAPYIPKPTAWQAPTTPGGLLHDVWRAGSNALGVALGPFKEAFKVAGVYNRAINMPYLIGRQLTQDPNKSIFDLKVWRQAYDGHNIYDQGSLKNLIEQYGDTDSFVAMKTLEGKNPGQIIDAYGTVNNDIINSIAKMVDQPDKFKVMLSQFNGAQVSAGRDLARVLFHVQPKDNKMYSTTGWHNVSGALDAVYQIVVDPLTWFTGGTSKALTKGEKLAELLRTDPSRANLSKVFSDKAVKYTWDNVLGKQIQRYAEGDAATRAVVKQEIARQVPGLNNFDTIRLLADNKVYNAEKAEEFFGHSESMTKLLAGSVEGTQFFRNGIPIARRSRQISAGFNRIIGDFFNGKLSEEAMRNGDFMSMMKDSHTIGKTGELASPEAVKNLDKITTNLSDWRRRIGRYAARHPGSSPIAITDDKVDSTLNVVRDLARTIYPKAHSEFFAQAFRDSTEGDRVILLRGLYTQIMHNMGLHGTAGGRDLMENILREKFGDKVNFTTSKTLEIPSEFGPKMKTRNLIESQPELATGRTLKLNYDGTVHPYNDTEYIGNLPWHSNSAGEASLADYAFNFNKQDKVRGIVDLLGGATRSKFVKEATNAWSTGTLFPRLGIRSTIDEAFFYSMMAGGRDLLKLAFTKRGRNINKAINAFTGIDEGIPPLKKAILNAIGKNPAKLIPEKSIYDATGEKVVQGRLDRKPGTGISSVEEWHLARREDIADAAMHAIANTVPEELHDYIWQAMQHFPDLPVAMSNSIIGNTGLESSLSGKLTSKIISDSEINRAYKEHNLPKPTKRFGLFKPKEGKVLEGVLPTGKKVEYSIKDLENAGNYQLDLAQYENLFFKFTKNSKNLGSGRNAEDYFDPATVFFRFNGLKTGEDFEKARDLLLERAGIKKIEGTDEYTVFKQSNLDNYLRPSQQVMKQKEEGWTQIESAVARVEAALIDMKNTFHGHPEQFNNKLYNHIKSYADDLVTEDHITINKAIRMSLKNLDFNTFRDLIQNNRYWSESGMINADEALMAHTTTNEGVMQAIQRGEQKGMEWMDAQNNHMFRQPVLWLIYTSYRQKYSALEAKFIQEQMADHGYTKDFATELAEKRFTEIAMNHASNTVLTFVDNPRVKSNLAWTLRNTGRFYRATEDFYRRVYRLKNVTPQVLYRLRLANIGFQSNGFIHPDQNGDPYLVMPADNLIFHAINGTIGTLTGKPDMVKQPLYNDFAFRLSMGNPSFQQDAGQPSLTGPFMAMPVMAVKNMLGWFGGGWGQRQASNIDKLVLGQINQNLTPAKALVPASLQRVWGLIPKGEWDQQTVSAAMQAIAYNAAWRQVLPPDQVAKWKPEEYDSKRADYLDSVKWTAHNILFLRSLTGLMSPISPTLMESKGVPDYVKNAGINGLKPEFVNILQAVMRNSKGNIRDPYEAALMAFTGKHPGKAVYTVARTGAQSIMVEKSQQTQAWLQSNAKAINKYGDVAFIFAPNVGNYDSNVYAWMEGMGMINHKALKDYFRDVQTSEDRRRYVGLNQLLSDGMSDVNLSQEQRTRLQNEVAGEKELLKASNPFLENALNQQGYGVGKQEDMLNSLLNIVADPTIKLDPMIRTKMGLAARLVKDAVGRISAITDEQNAIDGGAARSAIKQQTIQAIKELGGATGGGPAKDMQIQEAMRAIFIPILDNKVRTTYKAGAR